VLLAAPRGFCAGVERAVETVRQALARHGAPVYVRRQIVHNAHVVAELERLGAVFVAEADAAPPGAVLILSAHGVAPQVHDQAAARGLRVIDATCPLVTKVHREARRSAAAGHTIVLIGHPDHEETIGTRGEAPDRTIVVSGADEVDRIVVPDDERVMWLSQTTMIADEVAVVVRRLRERFPALLDPPREDICYAVTNRQAAVRRIAAHSDMVLVIGAPNSHNSNNMVPVALSAGAPAAYRVDSVPELRDDWLAGVATVGVASGASVPEGLVHDVLDWLASRGYADVEEMATGIETQTFALPTGLDGLRTPMAAAPARQGRDRTGTPSPPSRTPVHATLGS
jgi:4-hydroxy-3-methylbut-2-enyl diphosphate reductase